jgi:hypothetical protein
MIGVFGSTVRGEARKDSDIDLLVRFSKRKSLLAVVRLERELSEALGRKGEAIRHMSKDIRRIYPEVPWRILLECGIS